MGHADPCLKATMIKSLLFDTVRGVIGMQRTMANCTGSNSCERLPRLRQSPMTCMGKPVNTCVKAQAAPGDTAVIWKHFRTLKVPSHDSRKQTANAVQISVSRLNRAGTARLDKTTGALSAVLARLPGCVDVATDLRCMEIKTQYTKKICMRRG